MDTRNFTYMFYGFAAAWLILVAYAVSLVIRQRAQKEELRRVREMLGQREPDRP